MKIMERRAFGRIVQYEISIEGRRDDFIVPAEQVDDLGEAIGMIQKMRQKNKLNCPICDGKSCKWCSKLPGTLKGFNLTTPTASFAEIRRIKNQEQLSKDKEN